MKRKSPRARSGFTSIGIRFFYERTLKRPWPVFDLVRPRHPQNLPVVSSPQEVRDLLAWVKNPTAQMCLRLIYACGLRLTEGTQLQVSDIDAPRMLVHVRCGKGGNDRCVPLAPRVLTLLREYWQCQRPHPWLFPARDQQTSLPATTLQKTFTRVVRQRGMLKAASIHTLHHSYATHLLEWGVSLRVIQELLGHKSPRTTARYTHLTPPTLDMEHATINALMADLCPWRSFSMLERGRLPTLWAGVLGPVWAGPAAEPSSGHRGSPRLPD